jgi:hypothetical protein
MHISINPHQYADHNVRTIRVEVEAVVELSPRKRFDNSKLAALESDLKIFVRKRLNEALTPETNKEDGTL